MSSALHIVFVDFDDIKNPLLAGGQARATFEVSRRLVQAGHRVTVITSRFPGSIDGENQGIFYRHIGVGSRNVRLNNVAFFFALPLALRGLVADVIVECFIAPISTCLSPLYTSIPVIGMPTMFEADQFSKKYHLPFHLVERWGCRQYKYFLAYSNINKAKMAKLNPNIITRVIPNGVGEELFDVPTTTGDYALFIGRIDIFQKGLDLLLEARAKAGDAFGLRIVIAGNGPASEEEKLRQLIIENKLEHKVEFIGRVDGARKQDLLANAAFGLYPSRFEDFPLVPLEFAALSKPLICFDIPGMAWVPTTAALKPPAFDVAALRDALVALANDAALAQSLANGAKPFGRQYGWTPIAQQYELFFNDVLALERLRAEEAIV